MHPEMLCITLGSNMRYASGNAVSTWNRCCVKRHFSTTRDVVYYLAKCLRLNILYVQGLSVYGEQFLHSKTLFSERPVTLCLRRTVSTFRDTLYVQERKNKQA